MDSTAPTKLRDSQLYIMARGTPLLDFLIPTIDILATTEEEIDDSFPREDSDSDYTRILISYTNIKNKSMTYKLIDSERLDRTFDINDFLTGFYESLHEGEAQEEDPTSVINKTLLTALNMALMTTLGIDDDGRANTKKKNLSETVVRSVISIVFDDPLDAIIVVKEIPDANDKLRTQSIITGMWMVKQRKPVAIVEE